jgi:hypothetical protein
MLRKAFSPWIIIGMVGLVIALLSLTLALLWSSRSSPASPGLPTAIITKIPAPSPTLPGTTATPLVSPTPSVQPDPTLIPGTIDIGAYVQIVGTGGDGLRLRGSPGLDSEALFLGSESEVFEVRDGPQISDDFTWWYLVAPFDENRRGWAVAPYLAVIQNP